EEAEERGTKPGLFDIFSAGVEKEDAAEKEEEAEENDEGEEEDAEDDQDAEVQIDCAQPAAEDPEKKYTTFATKNDFEVMYKVDEDGVQQPAGLEKSDADIDRLALWNYSANLKMKAVLTLPPQLGEVQPHSCMVEAQPPHPGEVPHGCKADGCMAEMRPIQLNTHLAVTPKAREGHGHTAVPPTALPQGCTHRSSVELSQPPTALAQGCPGKSNAELPQWITTHVLPGAMTA
ncbi:hypothetical protein CYMTET_31355, partial [Cymbomonas tetramitiformis]